MKWLKDKTLGKIRRWYLRKVMRFIGEMNKEHLHKISENTPPELKKYSELAKIMNSNATSLHNLYKEAKDGKKFHEAFLYFFYEFEINLKHAIMSEMLLQNNIKALKDGISDLFPIYPSERINKIQKIGYISELMMMFCEIFGNDIEKDLKNINSERNFIIHNMLKEEMTEGQIKKSFENFFIKTNSSTNNAYRFINGILDERPKRIHKLLYDLEKVKILK